MQTTTRHRLCCEKLGTSHDVKGLPLVHFWSILLLKEQMMTSVRKTLKMLVWSVQNRSISSEICLENNHKIGRFLPIAFWWSLPQKPSEIPSKSAIFSTNLSIKILWNLTFSSATYQKPWSGELIKYCFNIYLQLVHFWQARNTCKRFTQCAQRIMYYLLGKSVQAEFSTLENSREKHHLTLAKLFSIAIWITASRYLFRVHTKKCNHFSRTFQGPY